MYSKNDWEGDLAPAIEYTNQVNQSTASWIESVFAKIADVFTKSEVQEQYYNKTKAHNSRR